MSPLVDFTLDPRTGVYLAPEQPKQVSYLDGAESALAEILDGVHDRSSASDELAEAAPDWPLWYHVSPYRWTLLDCLGLPGSAEDVLELGAGCGAVTRWLGEQFKSVTAIEGSLARAVLARKRCAGLTSVELHAGNFQSVAAVSKFDVATLIGVLEYSALYHPDPALPPKSAALDTLRIAFDALRTPGLLVVAIENQLGLRYLMGSPEDHTGRPLEGVYGYPRPATPVTFSRETLESLMLEAGFTGVQMLLPFPDYKRPATIVQAETHRDPQLRLENWLTSSPAEANGVRNPSVCRPLVIREVVRAGLLGHLADSFLIIGFKGGRADVAEAFDLDLAWSARHYSLGRRSGLKKRVTLRAGRAAPSLTCERWPDPLPPDLEGMSQRLSESFAPGRLLIFDVVETLAAEGLGAGFLDHVTAFHAWLSTGASPDGSLAGDAIDLVWWNVIVSDVDGAWVPIDQEWVLERTLSVDFVVWRMLRHFPVHYGACLPRWAIRQPGLFASLVLGAAVPGAGLDAVRRWAALDTAVSARVQGGHEVDSAAFVRKVLDTRSRPLLQATSIASARAGYAVARTFDRAARARRPSSGRAVYHVIMAVGRRAIRSVSRV